MNAASAPRLRFSAQATVEVGTPVELDRVGSVRTLMVPIVGGSVVGELSGTILPGGSDWQAVTADGVVRLSAKYPVRLDDERTVRFVATGVRSPASGDGAFCSTLRIELAGARPADYPLYVTSGVKRDNLVHFDMFEVR